MPRNSNIEEKLSVLPHSPGVYLMKNSAGTIIYVGKSKNLKNRVSSYFQSPDKLTVKTEKLVSHIVDFEIIVTPTEAEALLLENELIKRHTPHYNIKLKDSKSYPYIKLTHEEYPRLEVSHTRRDDKARYFGPYTSLTVAYDIKHTAEKVFCLPSCGKSFFFGEKVCRPCLNYHMKQCVAPCTGTVTTEEFGSVISDVTLFLKGDYDEAEASLTKKMYAASEQMRFEAAAKYRDSIKNLKALDTKQKIKSAPDEQKDIFGFYETPTRAALAILLVRDGVIIDRNVIHMASDEISDAEELTDLILRYYHNPETIPHEISLSFDVDEEMLTVLNRLLYERCHHAVSVHVPQRGKGKELCMMAVDNAREAIRIREKQEDADNELLVRLASVLQLEVVPERIESYDISNSADTDMYCGMIVLRDGRFAKSDYRSFSIRSVEGVDDYGAMREALTRRFLHITDTDDDSSLHEAPDLILLDGGAGHVSTVREAAAACGVDIPIFGMVKDQYHKTRTITDGEHEISIANDSQLFSFVYKIQEEVHRFTFSKMDASRRKKMQKMELTNVEGIGEAKAKSLYAAFPSREALKNATVEELCAVKGITPAIAERIIAHLRGNTEE